MRALLVGLLTLAFADACTDPGTAGAQTPTLATKESENPDIQTPETPKPAAIIKLADAYFATLPQDQRPKDLELARDDFVSWFFVGFTNPSGSWGGDDAVGVQGFKTGQEFRQAHVDKLKETFESFGYVATVAEGVWTMGMEHSGFKPHGRKDEVWWLDPMYNAVSDLPKNQKRPERGVTVRITGFLSPKGHYGHIGGYEREFHATKISSHAPGE